MTEKFRYIIIVMMTLSVISRANAQGITFDFSDDPEPAVLQDKIQTINVNGEIRQYIWAPPLGLEGPFPTIFMLHGSVSSADSIQKNLYLEEFAHPQGVAVAYPISRASGWVDGRGGLPSRTLKNGELRPVENDMAFFDALFKKLTEEKKLDPDNIFFSGISTGGIMAMRILCQRSEMLNSVGTLLANIPMKVSKQCNFNPGISMFMANGTVDRVMPYGGGAIMGDPRKGELMSVRNATIFFLHKNKCKVYVAPEKLQGPKSIKKAVYDDCEYGSEIVNYRLRGWGHSVPGYIENKYLEAHIRAQRDPTKKKKADMVEYLVNFFASHIKVKGAEKNEPKPEKKSTSKRK